ncbi:hypothetical protein PNA2_1351 [Pyrococcus sp. NA2]|uniref:MFS transporter n=1 Tax=Pyrococcus sp. (strain NA2) TaxID=342949 RepID=UPI000209AE0F|nr:MFS transporter [Pyrococcus sp. NA2]AEC52267.1 hypothetical protein PNA2_1351 [Pyrococcus sp. NA2]
MRKQTIVMLKSREKAKYSHKATKKGKWFYSFIPFKVFSGGMAPLIPTMIVNEGGSPGDIGLASGLGSLASMIGGVFWGRLSDRLKRRKIFLIAGILGSSFSALVMNIDTSITWIILMNVLYMFFLAATIPLPLALISREFRRYEVNGAIGKFNKLGGLGWVGGLILGLLLITLANPKIAILILGSMGIVSGILTIKVIREAPLHIKGARFSLPALFTFNPRKISLTKPSFKDEEVKIVFLSSFLFWLGSMAVMTQFPTLARDKGLDGETLYLVSISSSITSALTYQRVANSIIGTGLLNYASGLLLRGLGLGGILVTTLLPPGTFLVASIITYIILGYSWAIVSVSSSSIISSKTPESKRGKMFGSYNLVCSTGAIIGSFGGGYVTSNFGIQADIAFGLSAMIPAMYIASKKVKGGHPLNFGLFERSNGRGLGL